MFDHDDHGDNDRALGAMFAEAPTLAPSPDFDRRITRRMARARLIQRGVHVVCLAAAAAAITAILAPLLGALTPHATIPAAIAVLVAGLVASFALSEA